MLAAVHGESDSIPSISQFQREGHQVMGINNPPPHSKVMFGDYGEYLQDAGSGAIR